MPMRQRFKKDGNLTGTMGVTTPNRRVARALRVTLAAMTMGAIGEYLRLNRKAAEHPAQPGRVI